MKPHGGKRKRPSSKLGKKGGTRYGYWKGLVAELRYRDKWHLPMPTRWYERTPAGLIRYEPSEQEDTMPKAFTGKPTEGVPLTGATKGGLAKQYPELWGWLCDASYEDGTPVGLTQVTLKRTGPHIVGVLKIADQGGLKVEVTDASPERTLASLEAALSASPIPWQTDPYPLGGAKKRK